MRPIRVEVVTYTPTVFHHCQHCELTFREMGVGGPVHREQAREALPEELRLEFEAVSLWIHGLIERYGPRLRISLIDAASIEGFWKTLRYGLRRYPAVVVDGAWKHAGGDLEAVTPVIDRLAHEGPEERRAR
jgi:hypothetical protein